MWRALVLLTLVALPVFAASADTITNAQFSEPTDRYDHGVLGDAIEWGALILTVNKCPGCDGERVETVTIRLPETRVFEDIAPRLIADEDGFPLVMVVESDLQLGARLSLYDATGLYAATPFIGRPHRWLAPIGAADLDQDGAIEVAYIDRPHLAKELKVWRLKGKDLTLVARQGGLTNHRIGQDFITGGISHCNGSPEMIVVSGDWKRVMALRLERGDRLQTRDLGTFNGQSSINRHLNC